MNRVIYIMLGLVLSAPAMATVEQECAGTHAHAVYVCPAIYSERQAFSQKFSPPVPQVVTSAGLPSTWESMGANVPAFNAPLQQKGNEQQNKDFRLF